MKKQKAIYMAWLKLFSKYWPKKVSIDSIIDEAKVWKWTFYKYFKNKTDFYEKIVDDMLMDKWWEEEFWLLSKEEMLVSNMVWILFYLEKNDILKNICLENEKYFFWKINYDYIQKRHFEGLKEYFSDENDEDHFFLSEIIWSYVRSFEKISRFSSREEYEKFCVKFANACVIWYYSKEDFVEIDLPKIKKIISKL